MRPEDDVYLQRAAAIRKYLIKEYDYDPLEGFTDKIREHNK